jgi:hypothetical protein
MPEPLDTIRRVNDDQPMTLQELYAARATLDRYTSTRKTDVQEARRRVGSMIAELEPAPAPAPAAVAAGGAHVAVGPPASGKDAAKTSGNPVVGFIVLLVIVGGVVYACSGGSDDPSDSGGGRSDGMAKVMCEKFVEDRLKAPGTADFSGIFDTEITGSGNNYTVRGHVDAQNSFGAMLRSDYTCAIRNDGDDSWSLESLSGLE